MAYGSGNVIAASFGSALQFLNASNGQVLETVEDAHEGGITAVQWGPTTYKAAAQDVAVLATASHDKRVRLWRRPQL